MIKHAPAGPMGFAGLALAATLLLCGCTQPDRPHSAPSASVTGAPSPAPTGAGEPAPILLPPTVVATLPAAVYDAVIPGLVAAPTDPQITRSMTVRADTAVFGADRRTPVARIPARNFLGEASVVVPVRTEGPWTLVLTPSRQILPSQAPAGTAAPAQTAAWIPSTALLPLGSLTDRIVVSVSQQSLTITGQDGTVQARFSVGVGTADTPTPTNVTGYLQARYLDPAQGQNEHRIQLTSLHATGADEPYGGSDGGLIGIHYQQQANGAVSHGCVRLSADAIAAVDALPLGTAVEIVD